MEPLRTVAGLAVVACACACEGADASTVAGTDGVPATALRFQGAVRSNGVVAQIQTTMYDSELRTLSGGDSLVLSAPDGASRVLEASESSYVAQITTPSTTLTLELVRRDGSRHPGKLDLPPAFAITGPSATSRSAPMVFTWPAEPSLAVSVVMAGVPSTCTPGGTRRYLADPGTVTVQAADFANVPGACTLTVSVARESLAVVTGELAVSALGLSQVRTVIVETQP